MSLVLKNGVWRPREVPSFLPEVNWSHPLAQGLVALYVPGISLQDITGQSPPLTRRSGSANKITPLGPAHDSTAASSGLYILNMPANLKLGAGGGSIYWYGEYNGVAANGANLVGTDYDNAASSPFVGYSLGFNASSLLKFFWNTGGTFQQSTGATLSTGRRCAVASWQIGVSAPYNVWVDGASFDSGLWSSASAPSYATTAVFNVAGDNNDTTRNAAAYTYIAAIYSTPLTQQQAQRLTAEPFAMLRQRGAVRKAYYPAIVSAGSPTFSIAGAAAANLIMAASLGITGVAAVNPVVASVLAIAGAASFGALAASVLQASGLASTALQSASVFGITGAASFSPLAASRLSITGAASTAFTSGATVYSFAITGSGATSFKPAPKLAAAGAATTNLVPFVGAALLAISARATVSFSGSTFQWAQTPGASSAWVERSQPTNPWTQKSVSSSRWDSKN